MNLPQRVETVIVGAGMAGLACALTLEQAGQRCLVLERGDCAGGRVRSECVDGFLLDVGFQVLLTGYPTLRTLCDLSALDLRPFAPGARVFRGGAFATVSDPLRRPQDALRTLFAPVGTPLDKVRVLKSRWDAQQGSVEDLFYRSERTTLAALEEAGFSASMQERFWHPFLRGIYLDPTLQTSSRMMEFVLRMMGGADIAVPARGMGQLPQLLAAALSPGVLRCGVDVRHVDSEGVYLADGSRLPARHVVVATDPRQAAAFAGDEPPAMRGGTTLWFDAPVAPHAGPWLLLNGALGPQPQPGEINHVVVLSEVAPAYAPPGRALVCVNVIGVPEDPDDVLTQRAVGALAGWFGSGVAGWRLLRAHRLPHALPCFVPPTLPPEDVLMRSPRGIWVCGDHRAFPSIEGACASGVRVGRAISAWPGLAPVGHA